MSSVDPKSIRRGIRIQSVIAILLAAGLLLIGPVAAYSFLFGSLSSFIPNLLFTVLVVPKMGPDSRSFLRMVVIAEALKLFLMALICALVFIFVKPLAAGWFFTGLVVMILSSRLALLSREN